VFRETASLEESIAVYTAKGVLSDLDDLQQNYFENGGTFLVTVHDGGVIGTGAIRFLEDDVCELKRMWLLTEFHGQGLGYRMMQELLACARRKGYKAIRLQTDRVVQTRAVAFYRRLGFREIPIYDGDDPDDMAMEMIL
jgi:putative acetyltransferase